VVSGEKEGGVRGSVTVREGITIMLDNNEEMLQEHGIGHSRNQGQCSDLQHSRGCGWLAQKRAVGQGSGNA
jgi:hypothetical protein